MDLDECTVRKTKNLVKDLLIAMERIKSILIFSGYENMELTELLNIFEDQYYLSSYT